jgi:seryl-tRNA synthetase
MLDLRYVRTHPEAVKRGARQKHVSVDVDRLLAGDAELLALRQQLDELRARRNELSRAVPRASAEERQELIRQSRELGEALAAGEPRERSLQEELQALLLQLPNPPAPDVPEGRDESENVPLRFWGEPPRFDFTPLDHVALMERLDLVELARGAKVSGHRGYFLKREAALLDLALMRFALDRLVQDGFLPLTAPSLVRTEALLATGHFPGGEDETYHLERDDLWLAGTSEVPVTSLYRDEILDAEVLPLRLACFSPCFRREAGSYGRDLRGVFRVHQFNKVEQFIFCAADEAESRRWHERLLANAEALMQALELPYRVVNCCAGELSLGQKKRYDVEFWLPSEARYREAQSCSFYLDFQARRANVRYRTADGSVRYVHTLNNTALASPRILLPLLEVHQQADGSVRIPEALRPYLGGLSEIRR